MATFFSFHSKDHTYSSISVSNAVVFFYKQALQITSDIGDMLAIKYSKAAPPSYSEQDVPLIEVRDQYMYYMLGTCICTCTINHYSRSLSNDISCNMIFDIYRNNPPPSNNVFYAADLLLKIMYLVIY